MQPLKRSDLVGRADLHLHCSTHAERSAVMRSSDAQPVGLQVADPRESRDNVPDLKAEPPPPLIISWEPPKGAPISAAGEALLCSAAVGPHAEQPLAAEDGSDDSPAAQHAGQLHGDAQGDESTKDTAEPRCDVAYTSLVPSIHQGV